VLWREGAKTNAPALLSRILSESTQRLSMPLDCRMRTERCCWSTPEQLEAGYRFGGYNMILFVRDGLNAGVVVDVITD
jgi:hypothetical protein